MSDLERYARMIEGLAGTMKDNMWSDEILGRCDIIEKACKDIREIASKKRSGER